MAQLARVSGVSYLTVLYATRGKRLNRYDIAKKISDATAGEVSVLELLEAQSTDQSGAQ